MEFLFVKLAVSFYEALSFKKKNLYVITSDLNKNKINLT